MEKQVKPGKIIGVIVVIVLILIVAVSSISVIPTGYTGVRVTFGQVSTSVVPNGLNLKIPFVQQIIRVNNKQQDITFENTISSETSERNEVYFSGVTVTYQINAEKSSWIYANVSNYQNNLVSESLVASALKTASKSLTPTDVTNRSIIEPMVKDVIQKSLDEKYGSEVVRINKVIVNNATFDADYNEKIAQKQQAQMAYETQQIENKKNIEKAEADAAVKVTQAEADAKALKIAAEAEAEANRLINESLTDKVIKNKTVDKWDGKLPYVSGSGNLMLDVSDVLGEGQKAAGEVVEYTE